MAEAEYSEAAVEVLDILNHTTKEEVEKIPQSFIKFLTDISSRTYKVQLNHEYPVSGMNLRKETRELLGFIYITWWCSVEDSEKYRKIINIGNKKREEIKFQHNVNNFFNSETKEYKNNNRITSIVEYKEESIFKKWIHKILSFSRIKKEGVKV